MAAPTIVTTYSTSSFVTTGASKSVSVSCEEGDSLIVCMLGEGMSTPSAPTATGVTFNSNGGTGGTNGVELSWTALRVPKLTNVTITQTALDSTKQWGFICIVVRGCYGVRSSASTTGTTSAPSVSISANFANSAILTMIVDTAAVDGTTRTWKTVNGYTPTSGNGQELLYSYSPAAYSCYIGFYPDAGATGNKSTGMTAPSTMNFKCHPLELVGQESAILTNSSASSFTSAVTTKTINQFSVPQQANTAVIAFASVGVQPANGTDTAVSTTVSVGGRQMTSIAKVHSNNAAQGYIEAFAMFNPTPGSYTVTLTASTAADLRLDVLSVANVDQSNPYALYTGYGSSTFASVAYQNTNSRTSVYTVLVSGSNVTANGPNTPSNTSSFTNNTDNLNNLSNAGCAGIQGLNACPPGQTIGFTLAGGPWALIGINFNPVAYQKSGVIYGFSA